MRESFQCRRECAITVHHRPLFSSTVQGAEKKQHKNLGKPHTVGRMGAPTHVFNSFQNLIISGTSLLQWVGQILFKMFRKLELTWIIFYTPLLEAQKNFLKKIHKMQDFFLGCWLGEFHGPKKPESAKCTLRCTVQFFWPGKNSKNQLHPPTEFQYCFFL